jgi:hypothetical protein
MESGEYGIKYMEAAFNREAGSGDFFIEFDEDVWSHKLVKSFESQGGSQVMSSSFFKNDDESASNALLYIFYCQNHSKIKYSRGICSPALLATVKAKHDAKRNSQASVEQSNPTPRAICDADVTTANICTQPQVKSESIQYDVSNVISEYQIEIERLKSGMTYKTALCTELQEQKAYQTNKLAMEITQLKQKVSNHAKEKADWIIERSLLLEQVDLCNAIKQAKQMTEGANVIVSTLESMITQNRTAKRQKNSE